jgi:hypothetical protein
MKPIHLMAATTMFSALLYAQSPAATASLTVNGKSLEIKYNSPRVNGREGKLFGPGGRISSDPIYPVWRAGANSATKFHTDADLDLGGLTVPAGDYTLFVDVSDMKSWQLIINKQTGQWGLSYDKAKDLGRVKMTTTKPGALVEALKYTLAAAGPGAGKATLTLEWENVSASVPLSLR